MSLFVDVSDRPAPTQLDFWDPVLITKAEIDAEVERLSRQPRPSNGRREALIVHPKATAPGNGLAPGIRVTLSVLLPGESSAPSRHNATQVSFCIDGSGTAVVGDKKFSFGQYDVWNHPSWTTFQHINDTDSVQVRLSYSNAALLDQLGVYLVEDNPLEELPSAPNEESGERKQSPFGVFQLTDEGAWLMPYEKLISPPNVESPALYWPWQRVKDNLDKLTALGAEYRGRRLYLLYNPATGRTNGTTPNFFATITIRPPKIIDRPHRHVSAAINYYFHGRGHSLVNGKRYDWEAGDLMLSAPGWAVHHHASGPDEHVHELTIQDQPFHIALESLLWQEDLKREARLLGVESGFATNRSAG
ncbi:cupin domain-containing protein [Mycobacterium sp. pR1184]|uniref:cupin domain-containing protein n=1 Tax=Mycobacterium sp. pR1184 TaxID=3238981 RepID=UPI00351B57BD